nr:unnamed protein product [Digitaria exilis]
MTGAAPQPIYCFDLVTIRRRDGANDERGLVINSSVHVGKRLRVLLADGTVVSASKRGHVVADRSYFRPGHVVVAASDRGGQIGVVTGVATALDLVRFSSGDRTQAVAVARGVSPSGLRRVTELSEGGYVVSGPWLGRVLEVSHDVDVLFDDDDGALCRVTGAEHKLEAAGINNWTRYTDCLFYPGQRVTGGSSVFKASRWIRGYWKPTRRTGTVARVDMAGVVVCWVASMELGTSKPLIQASAPPAYQSCPHRLEIFPSVAVEPSHWCVGDRCFFRCHEHPQGACCNSAAPCLSSGGNQSGSSLSLLPPSTTRKDTSSPSMKSHRKRTRMLGVKRTLRLDQRHAEFERPMSVADTRTTVDVLWQDGTTQCGVPSASLLLFTASNEHDFIPGEHVVGTGPSATANALGAFGVHGGAATDEPAARFGVVRSLSSKDQTVCVAWSKPTTSALGAVEAVVDGSCDETVSAYDLARNFDQDFFYGDVVK